MRMIKVTDIQQLPTIEGVEISFQVVDKKIEAIIIKQNDEEIRIVKDGTYTDHLAVLVKEEEEYNVVYAVSGERDSETRLKTFSSYTEAKEYEFNLQMEHYTTSPIEEIKQKVKRIGDE